MLNCYTAIVTFMHYKDFDVIVSHSIFSVFVEKHQILHPYYILYKGKMNAQSRTGQKTQNTIMS